ncbi:MAG: hypothetical protein MJE77_10465 [Proteobacteria bacterium]|nr:hypothetical protein [Pseudomonadota bacterium]
MNNAFRMAIVSGLALSLAVCSSGKEPDKQVSSEPKPGTAKASPARSAVDTDAAAKAVDAVMAPYGQCRALLAADRSDGVADCAKGMADAASRGRHAVSDPAKPHMDAIEAAAKKLAGLASNDVEALRRGYGDVSKPIVALLTATPAAAKKYHVFECPMARGYNRWAQVDAEIANPYMGTRMLECGSEVHDHHQGMMGNDHQMKQN